MPERESKPWWRSKTMWFNGLIAAMATAEALSGIIREEVGPLAYVVVMMIVAFINMGLRAATEKPITVDRRYPAERGPVTE